MAGNADAGNARWLSVLNTESTAAPPFGVVELVGVTTDGLQLQVRRPTSANLAGSQLLILGFSGLGANAPGVAHASYPGLVLHEASEGTLAVGDTLGTQANSYKLLKGNTGYIALEATASGQDTLMASCFGVGGTGISGITVEEVDGSPSVTSVTTLRVDSADGFVVSTPGVGIARLDLAAATASQAGIVSTGAQTWAGYKTFDDGIYNDGIVFRSAAQLGITSSGSASSTGIDTTYSVQDDGGGYGTVKVKLLNGALDLSRIDLITTATTTSLRLTDSGSPARTMRFEIYDEAGLALYTGKNHTSVFGDVYKGGILTTAASAYNLDNLSDVTVPTPSNLDVLQWNGSAWVNVPASGLVTTATIADGDKGDITVSGSGATWTIDNDVVTYAKLQNVSATSRILGRKTAAAGDTEECTLSEVLDFVGSAAQGDILYRGAATWTRLGAGTAGQVLTTGGAGANPSWATGSLDINGLTAAAPALDDTLPMYDTSATANRKAVLAYHLGQHGDIPGGRLTPNSTNDPLGESSGGSGTLYYTPYINNRIILDDGTALRECSFSELSLSLSGSGSSVYDIWAYWTGSAVALEKTVWSSTTARATAITNHSTGGFLHKSGDATRRYIGTIATVTNACLNWKNNRLIWNMYNRIRTDIYVPTYAVGALTWTYASTTWRIASGVTRQANVVTGLHECDSLQATALVHVVHGSSAVVGNIGIGIDSATANVARVNGRQVTTTGSNGMQIPMTAHYDDCLSLGYHSIYHIERATTGTVTFASSTTDGTESGRFDSGLTGSWWC